jgi:hypothetical protein
MLGFYINLLNWSEITELSSTILPSGNPVGRVVIVPNTHSTLALLLLSDSATGDNVDGFLGFGFGEKAGI